jgi:hypothetical protein
MQGGCSGARSTCWGPADVAMLLNFEQIAGLRVLQRERDLALLGEQVAVAFPEAPARLGERFPTFVALAAQRGARQGLTHLVALGRYLACWVTLGAEFEAKPGFEWAASLLAAKDRAEGTRVFQLCRGVRERLAAQPSPTGVAAAAFDAALEQLDAGLQDAGDLGDLENLGEPARGGSRRRLKLGEACDLDVLDLRRADAVSREQYSRVDGQWQRLPVPTPIDALTLRPPGHEPAPRPAWIAVLCPPAGRDAGARMRLRMRAAHVCGLHPWARLNDSVGLRDWRGQLAQEVTWSVPAPLRAPSVQPVIEPTIASEGSPDQQSLDVYSCGLRESGAPMGDLHLVIATYPGEQHLMAWKREPWPVLAWPESAAGPGLPVTHLRLERDGVALDPAAWQAGFQALDDQLMQGLGRLASAWERTSGVTQGRLEAEPRLLCGDAAVTWGWAERPQGFLAAPYLRIAAALDLIACRLTLRFSGVLSLGGSLSRLGLHCTASESMQAAWERQPDDVDPQAPLAGAKASFRQPFVLVVESAARDELAMLNAASPVTGALVGSCGLRMRPEGTGLQWFATLSIEPAQVVMQLHDPLLGQEEVLHPLLPAVSLLEWSLG